MEMWHAKSVAEQLADHLREQLALRRWTGQMPGVHHLSGETGVHRKTAEEALRMLEREGLLAPQGVGKRRKIIPLAKPSPHFMRVAILLGEAADRKADYMVELHHRLAEAGHAVIYPEPFMVSLGMDPKRIGRLVERTEADVWVVIAGSREVLAWFSKKSKPVFALFGRFRRLPVAGTAPEKQQALTAAARMLIGLGHRRIVMMVRPRRSLPVPGLIEQTFLNELKAHGVPVSDYNLPAWEESVAGFHARLDSLFRVTRPTALIVDEIQLFAAAQQFLAKRRLRVPKDVSMICTDADLTFDWCLPTVAHIHWDSRPIVRRVVRWVANVSRGKQDLRRTFTKAVFVPGGTIGPARIKHP